MSTFIPESGLSTPNNLNSQSNHSPKGITPPSIVKEADAFSSELSSLGNSIKSTGHPIGRYRPFFSDLVTWTHPRASGIILTTIIGSILLLKVVNLPRLVLRFLWIALASSIALESFGRLVLHQPLVSQFSTSIEIDRKTFDPIVDEFHSLTNYLLSEGQRLLFARNIRHSSIALVVVFSGYQAIKITPLWIMSVIAILLSFGIPPLYLANKEVVDGYLTRASDVTSAHFENAKNVASKNVEIYSEKARVVAVDLGAKAGVDVNRILAPGPVLVNGDVANTLKKEDIIEKEDIPEVNGTK